MSARLVDSSNGLDVEYRLLDVRLVELDAAVQDPRSVVLPLRGEFWAPGVPHVAGAVTNAPACSACFAVLDAEWVGPLGKVRTRDVGFTLDGALIVAARVAELIEPFGGIRLLELPDRHDCFVMVIHSIVEVDVTASALERIDYCTRCNTWRGIRASDVYVLRELPTTPISRTDITIGFGFNKRQRRPALRQPAIFVDAEASETLNQAKLGGLVLNPVSLRRGTTANG